MYIPKWLKILFLSLIIHNSAFGIYSFAGSPGSTSCNFLKIGVGAKGSSLGGAYTTLVDDVTAIYWNPAGLSRIQGKQMGAMYLKWFEDINYQFIGYAHALKNKTPAYSNNRNKAFGIGIYNLTMNEIQGYDASGAPTKSLEAYDRALSLSYSSPLRKRLMGGVNIKIIDKKLASKKAQAYAMDIGTIYTDVLKDLDLSLVLTNLSSGIKFIAEKDKLPMVIKLGAGLKLLDDNLRLGTNLNLPNDNDFSFNLGTEYQIWHWFLLRLGYDSGQDLDTGLSYGLGLAQGPLQIDYAFVPYGDFGSTHRFSLSWNFGFGSRLALFQEKLKERFQKGVDYYRIGDLAGAYREFAGLYRLDPTYPEVKDYLLKIKNKIKEIQEIRSAQMIEEEISKHKSLGISHLKKDQLIQSREEFEYVLMLRPDDSDAKSYLEKIAERMKMIETEKIKSLDEEGDFYFNKEKYEDAIEVWEKILALDSKNQEAKLKINKAYTKLKEIEQEKKKKLAEERTKEIRKKTEKLYIESISLINQKKYWEAREKLASLLKLNPKHQKAKESLDNIHEILGKRLYFLGRKKEKQNNLNGALRNYKQAQQLIPKNKEVREAIKRLEKSMAKEKEIQAQESYDKGLDAYSEGKLQEAINLWKQVLKYDPEHLKAKRALERVQAELERQNNK